MRPAGYGCLETPGSPESCRSPASTSPLATSSLSQTTTTWQAIVAMNTIQSIFGSAYSLLSNGLSNNMSTLALATKKISFAYHFVRLIIKAKAPYYRFSRHPHIAGLECAIVCIPNPVLPGRHLNPIMAEHWTTSVWRKIKVIGHCIRLIMMVKDDIEDPPYVHDVVDKSYETIAIYIAPEDFDWEERENQLSWELPLFPSADESVTEVASMTDGNIPRQFRFYVLTSMAARSLKKQRSEPYFEALQLY